MTFKIFLNQVLRRKNFHGSKHVRGSVFKLDVNINSVKEYKFLLSFESQSWDGKIPIWVSSKPVMLFPQQFILVWHCNLKSEL